MRLGLPFLRQARNHKKYTQTKIAVLVNFPLLAGRGRFQYNLRLLLELSLCARVMSKKCAKTQGTIYIYIYNARASCVPQQGKFINYNHLNTTASNFGPSGNECARWALSNRMHRHSIIMCGAIACRSLLRFPNKYQFQNTARFWECCSSVE